MCAPAKAVFLKCLLFVIFLALNVRTQHVQYMLIMQFVKQCNLCSNATKKQTKENCSFGLGLAGCDTYEMMGVTNAVSAVPRWKSFWFQCSSAFHGHKITNRPQSFDALVPALSFTHGNYLLLSLHQTNSPYFLKDKTIQCSSSLKWTPLLFILCDTKTHR